MSDYTKTSVTAASDDTINTKSPFMPKFRVQRSPPESVVPAKKQRSHSLSGLSTDSQLDDLQSFLATDFDVRDGIRRIIMLMSQSTRQINTRLDSMARDITDLTKWKDTAEKQLVEVNKQQDDLACEMDGANEQIIRLQDLVEAQKAEIKSSASEVDALENRQRRDNLLFFDVPFVNVAETWNESKQVIKELCQNIGLPEVNIDRAHRIGQNSSSRSAPIIARIPSNEDRDKLLAKWRDLKEQSIGISEDFSKSLRVKHKFLNSERKRLVAEGKTVKLRLDKLIVNN